MKTVYKALRDDYSQKVSGRRERCFKWYLYEYGYLIKGLSYNLGL